MTKILIFSSLIFTLFLDCSSVRDNEVEFTKNFLGGKLDSISFDGSKYKAFIKPAFEPVNESPYFAFKVRSKKKQLIKLVLNYGNYKHRYVPKLSYDRINWTPINSKDLFLNKDSGEVILNIVVSNKSLFIAAQEVNSTVDNKKWINKQFLKSTLHKIDTIGFTPNNNPLVVLQSNENLKKAIVIVARQHPPEIPGGTFAFNSFYETFFDKDYLSEKFRKQYNIISFPMPNPDGVDSGYWRHNSNGVDLNRDWIEFTQPETKAIKQFLESKVSLGLKIEFAIDFHTSYSGPYLLTLDSLNQDLSKGLTKKWINNINSKSSFLVEERKRSQKLPYCYNYFFNQFNSEAVTYEEGDEINRDTIKKRARVYAKQLINTLLN